MNRMSISIAATMLLTSSLMAQGPQSVRGILGEFNPIEHTKAQLRAGYIQLDTSGEPDQSAVAIGGHVHLDSKRYYGIMVGTSLYTVQDMGVNSSDPAKINPDFFDSDLNGFSMLSEMFVDGQWGHTEIKIGRQILDTPHADSDDIRMVPNYFMAYVITNNDIEGLTLTAAKIDQMAGWENGVDASKFVDLSDSFGLSEKTNGAYILSAVYEGIENLSLQLWGYQFDDYANVIYAEVGYSFNITDGIDVSAGLQYDTASDTGDKLGGDVNANTWGASVQLDFENAGISAMAAYNSDSGDTGAFGSLGGGPFFTSLEDQTLDAIGQKGSAWIVGGAYDFSNLGVEGLTLGAVYGSFAADDSSAYDTDEIDAVLEYSANDRFTLTAAYASIDDNTAGKIGSGDYNQFRIIANLNF